MKFTRNKKIIELREGDQVDDIYVVKIKRAITPYKRGYSFEIILTDETGASLSCFYWGTENREEIEKIYNTFNEENVLHIVSKVSAFGNKLVINLNERDKLEVLSEEQYDKDMFLLPPKRDIEDMKKELENYISSIKNSHLKLLLEKIFTNEFTEKFSIHPGAIQYHHNWKGGLMQHTIEVAEICELLCKQNPEMDRDLLLTGALLHDLGKLVEISVGVRVKGTIEGQFIGHSIESIIWYAKYMEELKFPNLLRIKIIHMILSHHGRLEFGATKEPMFPEAFALHHADCASAVVSEMVSYVEESKLETNSDTNYHRNYKRNILLK
jgi:3'-5' exoribonuclease